MKKKLFVLIPLFLAVCVMMSSLPVNAATYHIDFSTTTDGLELANLDTGTVVYQKNADKKLEPASTTKIMTYIIACENIKNLENTKITVKKEVVDSLLGTGSSMSGVKEGETLTALQLLNCMMIPSGNDAALVLADYVGGGDVNKFVDMMNAKAKELGCKNTHFANPHGLHDPNHYTTADDLLKIAKYALSLPYFSDITSKTIYKIAPTNKCSTARYIYTTNSLINVTADNGYYYYKYATGIKTGHDVGYSLVSSAVKDGSSYLCVALNAPDKDANGKDVSTNGAMIDSRNLFKWAFNNLKLKTVITANDAVCDITLNYAWNKDKLQLVPEKSYSTILPEDVEASSVFVTPHIPKSIDAPIKKGQVIGTATLTYANQELTTVNLVAAESVERSELLHSMNTVKSIFTSTWFIVIASIIVTLLIIYIILALIYNRKKKNLRRVKKYRKM